MKMSISIKIKNKKTTQLSSIIKKEADLLRNSHNLPSVTNHYNLNQTKVARVITKKCQQKEAGGGHLKLKIRQN